MDTDTKTTIFNALNLIPNVEVFQQRPEILETFPCITFFISNNLPVYTLGGVGGQNIEVTVDIWAETSDETSRLLPLVEAKMRELGYLLSFNTDIIDPDDLSHLNTRFTY